MTQLIIDAENCIVGRLSSIVAKELLKGKEIHIVNAEKALIIGNPEFILSEFRQKIERGDPYKGPFYPRPPEKILKRIIRGMLPYKQERGRQAFKRLKTHISVPEELEGKEIITLQETENSKAHKGISLGTIAQRIGARKVWQ